MDKIDIIRNITERTGGDIYLGVVGAVRTGKSTFIKKFMEKTDAFNKLVDEGKLFLFQIYNIKHNP